MSVVASEGMCTCLLVPSASSGMIESSPILQPDVPSATNLPINLVNEFGIGTRDALVIYLAKRDFWINHILFELS